MVWRVTGLGCQVQEERLVRVDDLRIADEPDRMVGQVPGQVIAILRRARRVHRMVVVDQVGVPRTRFTAEIAVEALEATTQRPAALERGHAGLFPRGQMPLADAVGAVPVLGQNL